MSSPATPNGPKKHVPFVPETMEMKEFTLRAILLGLLMTVVLGAANAYLGLRAGITIAATYPAAVIAMAAMRAWKGSLLEENIARTAGSIGESVAAGAIFTIPAFLLAKAWPSFRPRRRLLEVDRADHGGQHSGRAFYLAGAARDGGRSRTSLSRVSGRFGNSQGRAARRAGGEISLLEYRDRRGRLHSRQVWLFAADQDFTSASAVSATARSGLERRAAHTSLPRAAQACSPRPASALRISAWATSSACAWPPFNLPAA